MISHISAISDVKSWQIIAYMIWSRWVWFQKGTGAQLCHIGGRNWFSKKMAWHPTKKDHFICDLPGPKEVLTYFDHYINITYVYIYIFIHINIYIYVDIMIISCPDVCVCPGLKKSPTWSKYCHYLSVFLRAQHLLDPDPSWKCSSAASAPHGLLQVAVREISWQLHVFQKPGFR